MFWYLPFLVVVHVYSDPCHYNVAITATTPLFRLTSIVSVYHLILISIERYVAIVHPLKYEARFTDRTLKWSIAAAWLIGIPIVMTFWFWLIDADLSKCDLIPAEFYLMDVFVGYLPVCGCMFFVYGKILVVWWRQRRRVAALDGCQLGERGLGVSAAVGTSGNVVPVNVLPLTDGSKTDKTQDARHKPPTGIGEPSSESAAVTNVEEAQQQQRQKTKSRRREFKAVYLTAAIVGAFVILWFPNMLARFMAVAGYSRVVTDYLFETGGAFGIANYAFSWLFYAAVSKSYRRAYRRVLLRIGCCCWKNVTPQIDNSLAA